jgi:hypothetical protein
LLRCAPDMSAAPPSGAVCHPAEDSSSARKAAEQLIERCYARRYGALITAHYPDLLSVHAADGSALAAAGYRSAAGEALYLEVYLDRPVEEELAQAFRRPVARSEIVEIGSLASRSRAASIRLFDRLAQRLQSSSFRYAVVTATTGLRQTLDGLGLAVLDLGAAEPLRLPDQGRAWGSYYETCPRIIAGDIRGNAERIQPIAGETLTSSNLERASIA